MGILQWVRRLVEWAPHLHLAEWLLTGAVVSVTHALAFAVKLYDGLPTIARVPACASRTRADRPGGVQRKRG